PAAFAENEEKPEVSDPASTESGTPESPNDVDNEESPEEGDSTGEPELPSSQSPEPSAESTESSDMSTNQVDPMLPTLNGTFRRGRDSQVVLCSPLVQASCRTVKLR